WCCPEHWRPRSRPGRRIGPFTETAFRWLRVAHARPRRISTSVPPMTHTAGPDDSVGPHKSTPSLSSGAGPRTASGGMDAIRRGRAVLEFNAIGGRVRYYGGRAAREEMRAAARGLEAFRRLAAKAERTGATRRLPGWSLRPEPVAPPGS